MNRFMIAAATAALLTGTALVGVQAQEAQGTGESQEELLKKKQQGGQSGGEMQKPDTQAAPEQQQEGETPQGQAGTESPEQQQQQTGESEQQQPSMETTGSIDISTEQRTELTTIFREEKAEPVDIDVDVNVGAAVPRTVTLRPLPPRVIEIVPEYREYRYFVLADGRIVIVDPDSFEVVYILVV
jgi:hypothetical protein